MRRSAVILAIGALAAMDVIRLGMYGFGFAVGLVTIVPVLASRLATFGFGPASGIGGSPPVAAARPNRKDADVTLGAFHDVEQSVREQVDRIRAHPWTKDVPAHGLVF